MGGVFDLLVRAVEERRTVRFTYAGDPHGATRLVHPHVLFRSPSGVHCIDAVQIGGHRGRLMPLPAWRVFSLDRIDEVHLLEERFAPHPDADKHRHEGTVAVCCPG